VKMGVSGSMVSGWLCTTGKKLITKTGLCRFALKPEPVPQPLPSRNAPRGEAGQAEESEPEERARIEADRKARRAADRKAAAWPSAAGRFLMNSACGNGRVV